MKTMYKMMNNRKGFTLIELIVVIAILAILALIAVPRLTNFKNQAAESADLATARTILSAATLAEANDGSLEEDTIEKYVDIDVEVVDNTSQIPNKGWCVLKGEPLKIYKDGKQILPEQSTNP